MKRFSIIFISCCVLFISCFFLFFNKDVVYDLRSTTKFDSVSTSNIVLSLRDQYNNSDIVGVLEIPSVFKTIVVKYSDNEYYLTHDINNKYSALGSVFMDYRVSYDSKKVLIYGHNIYGKKELPFSKLDNYVDKSYFLKHPVIYFYTLDGTYTYDIFSSYVETSDFDYVNVNDYNGLSYLEHINKLKNKSNYDTGIKLSSDSKIIILQTCNTRTGYDGSMKNTLVMGVLRS